MADLKIIAGLRSIGDILVDALVDEFVAQGHNNTGATVDSIAYTVQAFANVHQLDLSFVKYAVYQDKGVAANRIPFSPGSGAKSSKYIRALMIWATQRGLVSNQKQAKAMAFAIAHKHKQEGMPTSGAYAFSQNGRRTGFFSDNPVFNTIEEKVRELMNENVFALLEDAINDVQSYINHSKAQAA